LLDIPKLSGLAIVFSRYTTTRHGPRMRATQVKPCAGFAEPAQASTGWPAFAGHDGKVIWVAITIFRKTGIFSVAASFGRRDNLSKNNMGDAHGLGF
jgi:hypothetical protein